MDKELKETLDKLFDKLLENLINDKSSTIKKKLSEAYEEEATISIKKFKDGRSETKIEGSNLALLITLAGLEKCILKKLNTPNSVWEMIKHNTGAKETNGNE